MAEAEMKKVTRDYSPLVGDVLQMHGFRYQVFSVDPCGGRAVCAGTSGNRKVFSRQYLIAKNAVIDSRGDLSKHRQVMNGNSAASS